MPEISDFLTATSGPFSVSSIDCGAATGPSAEDLEQQQPIIAFAAARQMEHNRGYLLLLLPASQESSGYLCVGVGRVSNDATKA